MHMTTHEEAAAAMAALDNKHKWEGMESPMVVRWMDRELQKRRRETRQGRAPGIPCCLQSPMGALVKAPMPL